MKKLLRFSVSGLIALSLLMSATGVASAHEGHIHTVANIGGTNMPYPADNSGTFDASSQTNIKINGVKTDVKADLKADAQAKVDNATSTDDNGRTFFDNYSDHFENVIEKLTAVYERMIQISNRIDTRMRKLSAEGVNITASSKFVSSARAELNKAKLSIDAANTSFKTEMNATSTDKLTGSTIKLAFPKTLANLKAAKDSFKRAHRDLVKAIGSMKPGVNTDTKATTSASANVKINN